MKKKQIKGTKPKLVSHYSNTGKRMSSQHTSYPLLVFILLLLGVFMTGFTLKVSASDVVVSAFVQAPIPTVPATIITPVTNARFNDSQTTVTGTCAAADMVKLYRNNNFSGAVLCAIDNTFQIQTALFEGSNDLQARVYNITNDEGPQSPVVRVYYDVPVPLIPGTNTPEPVTSAPAIVPQFMISAENLYKGYKVGDTIEWQIGAVGGTAPYAFSINWGDGNTSIVSRRDEGVFTTKHVYKKVGSYKGSYVIRVTASDANDKSSFIQLMIIIQDSKNVSNSIPAVGSISNTTPTLPFNMQLFWPAYVVTFLMVISFWLGQRRTLVKPKHRLHAHKG